MTTVNTPNRRSIRLKDYEYTQPGYYFVTVCTKNLIHHFGKVDKQSMVLSKIGHKAEYCLLELEKHFMRVKLDQYVIMPNHMHFILIIRESPEKTGVMYNAPTASNRDSGSRGVLMNARDGFDYSEISPPQDSLPVIIRTFKGAVTRWCNRNGYTRFSWQRNYYERIVRNEQELYDIRQYIVDNPRKWELDKYKIVNHDRVHISEEP